MIKKLNACQLAAAHTTWIARWSRTSILAAVLWGFAGAVEAVVLPLAQAGQSEGLLEPQQSVPPPVTTGLPFRLAPGISAAGYGLNTNNDGVQNFGEVGIDCGGAGARSCVDIELDVQITSDVLLDPARYADHRFHLARGTLNGHLFQMVYPEAGQPGFDRSNAGVVMEWPTRMGIPHAPPSPPYELTEAVPSAQERGATVIAFPGVTGGHPYVFSAQLAVLAARYLRELRGLDTIVVVGSSYGAAAALIDAAAYPHVFDGAVAFHAPYDGCAFLAMAELNYLQWAGSGLPVVHPLHYSARDSMRMAAAQAGLTPNQLDLTRLGSAQVPAIVVLGEVDSVWFPGWRVAADEQRMAAEGIDWVRIKNAQEAGHGGPEAVDVSFNAIEELFTMIDERRKKGLVNQPATDAPPRRLATDYDEILRSAPQVKPHPRVRELWSNVSLIEPGSAGRAAFADGGTVYTGSLQGFLTRRTWKSGAFQIDWSVPLGRAIEAIECTGQTLVVGSKRGLALVDAQRGTLIRETVGIGSVSDVEVGDLIPEVPGLEIAARADQDVLHVESLDTGVRLSSTVVGTGGTMRFAELGEQPRLFIPLSLGHVAGFHFVKVADQDWIPEATWLSEYLAQELTAIIHMEIDGEPRVVAGGDGGTTLAVINPRGEVVDRIALSTWVETLTPWDSHQLVVAGSGGIFRVDLATRASDSTDVTTRVHPFASDGSHVVTTDLDGDGVREVIAFQHASTAVPSIVVRNAACEPLWRRDGRWTSSALDVSYVAAEQRWELSVLDRNWQVDRFDLETGAVLGSLQLRRPTFTQSPARRLVRLSGAPDPTYEAFLYEGDVFGRDPGAMGVGTRCGGWVVAHTGDGLASQQRTLLEKGDQFQKLCAAGEADPTKPLAEAPLGLLSERFANVLPHGMGLAGGSLRFVDISGPRSHVVMTTGGGQVASYAVQGSSSRIDPVPQCVVDIAGTQTSLATGNVSGRAVVVVGSWLRNEEGHSLQLLDASTLTPIAAIAAGYVLGTALVDLDGDGSDEVVVGTQDGWLRVYSSSLELLFEWSAGDLNVGVNGALFAVETSQGVRVAFAVSGGFRVVEISR
jgi:pimeloyl-ACP methyl ester carboxylesterase